MELIQGVKNPTLAAKLHFPCRPSICVSARLDSVIAVDAVEIIENNNGKYLISKTAVRQLMTIKCLWRK
jgi:hypothetical protein